MEDFNQIVIKTLAEQLIRGYQIRNEYGGTENIESPLQVIVRKHIEDNKKVFIDEVAKVFNKEEILKEAIKEKIDSDLKSEWTRKDYEQYFTTSLSEKLQKEIIKDMKVLLEGKKITVEIV